MRIFKIHQVIYKIHLPQIKTSSHFKSLKYLMALSLMYHHNKTLLKFQMCQFQMDKLL